MARQDTNGAGRGLRGRTSGKKVQKGIQGSISSNEQRRTSGEQIGFNQSFDLIHAVIIWKSIVWWPTSIKDFQLNRYVFFHECLTTEQERDLTTTIGGRGFSFRIPDK